VPAARQRRHTASQMHISLHMYTHDDLATELVHLSNDKLVTVKTQFVPHRHVLSNKHKTIVSDFVCFRLLSIGHVIEQR
jgi:hypothetical protein